MNAAATHGTPRPLPRGDTTRRGYRRRTQITTEPPRVDPDDRPGTRSRTDRAVPPDRGTAHRRELPRLRRPTHPRFEACHCRQRQGQVTSPLGISRAEVGFPALAARGNPPRKKGTTNHVSTARARNPAQFPHTPRQRQPRIPAPGRGRHPFVAVTEDGNLDPPPPQTPPPHPPTAIHTAGRRSRCRRFLKTDPLAFSES
jgi:hypothetical protein